MVDDDETADTATDQSEDGPVVLPDGATDEDVEVGTPYRATVNDTTYYGAFATLAGSYPDDVSGLVHRTNMPSGYGPEDFTAGDTLAVQLSEHKENGDLSFELVDVIDSTKESNGTQSAPIRDESPAVDESNHEEEQAAPAASALSQSELDAITARLDGIESHLGVDTPTVRARVVDAGEDATLLRVLDRDSETDVDHGEVVTVTFLDAGGHEIGEGG
jgi:predicted RNA-binding protein with RPS1 domain